MAYRKRRSTRKRTTRKSRPSTASGLAKTVAIGLSGIALRMLKNKLGLNTEMKYLDTTQSGTLTATATGLQYPLLIPQGLTNTTRTGDSIRLVSFKFNILMSCSAIATRSSIVKLYLVKFKDSRGATMASDVFLDDPASVQSFLNMGNTVSGGGYDIIKTWTTTVEPPSTDANAKMLSYTWKPFNQQIKWTDSDTTGASNQIIDGQFALFIHANSTAFPTYTLTQRVRFVDN